MENVDLKNETANGKNPVLGAVFSPLDYAEDAFPETLNFMSDEELSEIDNFDNEDELREYLQQFFERT